MNVNINYIDGTEQHVRKYQEKYSQPLPYLYKEMKLSVFPESEIIQLSALLHRSYRSFCLCELIIILGHSISFLQNTNASESDNKV